MDLFPAWRTISPGFGDRLGGVNFGRSPPLLVIGYGFHYGREYRCVFSNVTNNITSEPAEIIDIRTIVCTPPLFDGSTPSLTFQNARTTVSILDVLGNLKGLSGIGSGSGFATANEVVAHLASSLDNDDDKYDFVHINKRPFFVAGVIDGNLDQGETYSFDAWATMISPGVEEDDASTFVVTENDQKLEFVVDSGQPSAFESRPVLSLNGSLYFKTHPDFSGLVTVSMFLRDNGGLLHGGIDTSPSISFEIHVRARDMPYEASWPQHGKLLQVLEDSGAHFYPSFIHTPQFEVGVSGRNMTYKLTSQVEYSSYFSIQPTVSSSGTLSFSLNQAIFGNISFFVEII